VLKESKYSSGSSLQSIPPLTSVITWLNIDPIDVDREGNEVQFSFPKDGQKSGNQHAKDDVYNFVFNGCLDMMTQQETVFNTIAKDVNHLLPFLNGVRWLSRASMGTTGLSSLTGRRDRGRPTR
jgi:hypothetical protein